HQDGDMVSVLHLAWDCCPKDEPLQGSSGFPRPVFLVPDFEDDEDADYLLTVCRRVPVAEKNGRITYCLGNYPYPHTYFDENHIFQTSDQRLGLNCCATFVVHVFHRGRFPLIKIEGWPSRDSDIPDQRCLVQKLEEYLQRNPAG